MNLKSRCANFSGQITFSWHQPKFSLPLTQSLLKILNFKFTLSSLVGSFWTFSCIVEGEERSKIEMFCRISKIFFANVSNFRVKRSLRLSLTRFANVHCATSACLLLAANQILFQFQIEFRFLTFTDKKILIRDKGIQVFNMEISDHRWAPSPPRNFGRFCGQLFKLGLTIDPDPVSTNFQKKTAANFWKSIFTTFLSANFSQNGATCEYSPGEGRGERGVGIAHLCFRLLFSNFKWH